MTQVGGNNGTTYTVKAKNSSVSGNAWVKATVNGVAFTKEFWVGKPKFTLTGEKELEVRMSGIATIDYINGGGYPGNVTWSRSGAISYVAGGRVNARFRAGSRPGYGTVFATVTNACGTSQNNLYVKVTGGHWYSIYPNPASDVITITIDKDQAPKDINTNKIRIRLYDNMKILKKQTVLTDYQATINVSDMKDGIYILQIITDKETFEEKVIVSRQ